MFFYNPTTLNFTKRIFDCEISEGIYAMCTNLGGNIYGLTPK